MTPRIKPGSHRELIFQEVHTEALQLPTFFVCNFLHFYFTINMQEQKRRIEADTIMKAYLKSGKNFDEIMTFLSHDDF